MDHQPGPGVRHEKKRRDRLIRLAQAHPTWTLGFLDETWWSRLAQPTLHTWTEADEPLRLLEQHCPADDPDPKALACYGLLARYTDPTAPLTVREQLWLRFVDGRPVSGITTQFLAWCATQLAQQGQTALLLVWDNASWHISRQVRAWLREHNRQVKATGKGVRIVVCQLPVKAPWLNPIEPKWVHGQRRVHEPDRLLTARELADRVCATFGCAHEPHLAIPDKAA